MIIHATMIPFFVVTAVVGAAWLAHRQQRQQRSPILGGVAGAVAGLLGPWIFMLPLNSCTFEPERESIDYAFGVGLFALGAVLAIWAAQWLLRLLGNRERASDLLMSGQSTAGTFKSTFVVPTLLLTPTIAILLIFLYFPVVDTFRLSTLLVRLGAPRTRFQCVANFTSLFDPDYYEVLFNTFFIAAAIVIVGLILGLAIAYLAYQPVRGASIYRTLLIWPYAISPAIAGIIFFVMFDPVAGVINHMIRLLGGEGLEWIRDPWLARFAVIATSVWKTLGYNILFYIAGLQTVPKDLQEAAAIDGANAWQRFRNVVLPALSPITFFLIVTNITYAFFNIFGTIDFLTKGGPAGATSVSIYEIVQLGIRQKDLGRAAAQSIVLFILVIGVTWFQFRTSGRRVTYGA